MKNILLIDDDPSIRTVFKRFLGAHGYSVEIAADGNEGMKKISEKVPDLLITDIMMPEKDGLEVVLALREEHPDLPVIAISGGMHSAPMDFLPIVKKFGARKVFYKPVELEKLLAAIKEELAESESTLI